MALSRQASWVLVAVITVAAVFLTRWPFRSEFLFSWDSANFALAMERIDISAHRPHPPGYLGYVVVSRALQRFTADANSALVLWNILATALAALLLVRFADESESGNPLLMLVATAAIVVTSPLLWFYSEIAEIYPSELLVALLVGLSAWRVTRGDTQSVYPCVVALAVAAVFKLTAAVLMAPLAFYAWWHVPRRQQVRSAAVFAGASVVVAAFFITLQPDLAEIVRAQFLSSTAASRVLLETEPPSLMRTVNRGFRSTLLALVAAVGPINALGLLWWGIRDRRVQPLGLPVAVLWLVPSLLVFVLVHIAKPGYVLPLLPIPVLVLAAMYSRLRPLAAAVTIGAQAVVNVLCFVGLRPFSDAWTGGPIRYSSKSVVQRAASDLQALTYPAAFTVADSDRNMRALLTHMKAHCPRADAVIVAGTDPLDWRRIMWYFPAATAVHVAAGRVRFVARGGNFESVSDSGMTVRATCPGVWLAKDAQSTEISLPASAVRIDGLGFLLPPGDVTITPGDVTVSAASAAPR